MWRELTVFEAQHVDADFQVIQVFRGSSDLRRDLRAQRGLLRQQIAVFAAQSISTALESSDARGEGIEQRRDGAEVGYSYAVDARFGREDGSDLRGRQCAWNSTSEAMQKI